MAFHLLAVAVALASLAGCDHAPRTLTAAVTPPARPAQAPAAAAVEETAPRVDPQPAVGSVDAVSDSVLASRIRASLLSDPALTGADVSINADRGIVSLTGTVRTQEQAAIASAHAQRPDGVMRIDNHLSVSAQ